jgi:hypothetical protein
MSAINRLAADTVDGGPLRRLEYRLGLVTPHDLRPAHRALIVVLITWAPLALSAAAGEFLRHDDSFRSFLLDFGAHARFLVATPLLVLAEATCFPRLAKVTNYFLDSGIVQSEDRDRYLANLAATARLAKSLWAEILGIALAYALTAGLVLSITSSSLPLWAISTEGNEYTFAARWQILVSLPLLIVLLYRWMWRQFVWWNLMLRISRLNLRLYAAHADGAGGLKFLSGAFRGYWPLAFAISAIGAGRVSNQLQQGFTLYDSRYLALGLVAFVLVVFLMPFTVFAPTLRKLKERGIFEYGTLNRAVGRRFERKWLIPFGETSPDPFESPDFSATTDLNQIVWSVHRIQFFPISVGAVRQLILITLAPFTPVVLSAVPFDVVVAEISKLLL